MRDLIRHSVGDDVWLSVPGTYRRGKADGRFTATMSCPKCGRPASLFWHEIAANGDVSPSLVCPHDGCDYHAYVTLDGWKP